jgi:carboxylesterase
VNGFLLLTAFVAAWWAVRTVIARREERRFEAAYRRGADGIIAGAEPVRLTGPRRGAILLIHGYNDSPQSVSSLARTLNARGWTVWVPLLPGHGRTLQAFARSSADEWLNAARQEYAGLNVMHDEIAVGGLSMGGAIALTLAAEHPAARAVIALAPYLHASMPLRLFDALAPVAGLGARYVWSGGTRSVHDAAAGAAMIAYRRSTPRLLVQLDRVVRVARTALPRVRQSVLVVQSREDNRIPATSAVEAFERLASTDKTLHWVTGTGHVVTVDYGHEEIERVVADWLETRLA